MVRKMVEAAKMAYVKRQQNIENSGMAVSTKCKHSLNSLLLFTIYVFQTKLKFSVKIKLAKWTILLMKRCKLISATTRKHTMVGLKYFKRRQTSVWGGKIY